MTVTITGSGANRTITWSKTKPAAIVLNGSDLAAQYFFSVGYGDHGTPEAPRTYNDLTNAEKLAILDQHLSRVVKDAAWTQHRINRRTADDAADATTETDFEL